LLGDMLAEKAAKNGWEGIIVYGCIRDVDVIMETDLGVQALGTNPLKTDKRNIGDVNVQVKFGGVVFVPGKFVYADNNGVIVSPQALCMPELGSPTTGKVACGRLFCIPLCIPMRPGWPETPF